MNQLLSQIKSNRLTAGLILGVLVILIGGFFLFNKINANKAVDQPTEEVDLNFDAEGPYALLTPRRDGNAMILKILRTATYSEITYELAYSAEGIDRGVVGTIDTSAKKGEYTQEVLFGTCSKNVCKYDQGVENGTLTLKIRKGNIVYRMLTTWHLQKPEIALGNLTSGDNHFIYKVAAKTDLSKIGFSIINDLSGAPKLPDKKSVLGKVYSLQTTVVTDLPGGEVTIELADAPPADAKIARFDEGKNDWVELETKITGSKLTAPATSGGIFTVLVGE